MMRWSGAACCTLHCPPATTPMLLHELARSLPDCWTVLPPNPLFHTNTDLHAIEPLASDLRRGADTVCDLLEAHIEAELHQINLVGGGGGGGSGERRQEGRDMAAGIEARLGRLRRAGELTLAAASLAASSAEAWPAL